MKSCPAALWITAELDADRKQLTYDRTRSRRAYVDLVRARAHAIDCSPKAKARRGRKRP
jgi:hypothetical protein